MPGENNKEDNLPLTSGSKNAQILPASEINPSYKGNEGSGLNIRLAFAIAAGAFGSAWQHGYNTGVLNAPQALITAWIQNCNGTTVNDKGETVGVGCDYDVEGVTTIWAIIVAAFCVGGMIGGSVVGVVSKSLGRKGVADQQYFDGHWRSLFDCCKVCRKLLFVNHWKACHWYQFGFECWFGSNVLV